jgi:heme exporter protein D
VTEFFHMGGYAAFVWPAWLIALLILGGLTGFSVLRMRAKERELGQIEQKLVRRPNKIIG